MEKTKSKVEDEEIGNIIENINDNMILLIEHINKITDERSKVKQELEIIRQHISKFFENV
tara:strand:- start:72 stop:251 length:180 start_codon:yes stop_codon:yes gene_type:complete